MLALTRSPPRAAQDEALPLHLALYGEALDAVVLEKVDQIREHRKPRGIQAVF